MRRVVLALLLAAPAPLLAQQRDWTKVEVKAEKVAEGVWMITGAGGNIGLSAGADGAFLIDDQYAPLTDKIKAAVASVTDKPIKFLLNTHYHPDHVGGNENLGAGGSLIVAHENARKRLSTDWFNEAFGRDMKALAPAGLPVVTFTESVSFHWNGEEIRAFHVPPAHTDGDTAVYFVKTNVLHAGDLVFNGLYPVIDYGAGGSIDGMIAACDLLMGRIDEKTRVIPGHGPLTDKAGVKEFRDMLATVRDRIKPMVAAGKSVEEVRAIRPTAEFDAKWGGGFNKPDPWVGIVYASLGGKLPTRTPTPAVTATPTPKK
jgi:glyoxylase-like metal-dependent hydrolase (beta-lactamase superfamily II)